MPDRPPRVRATPTGHAKRPTPTGGAKRPTTAGRAKRPTPTGHAKRPPRTHNLRRALWVCTTVAMVIAVLFVFVFPTRTYLSQRSSLIRVSSQVSSLDAQNKALAGEVAKLNTETAIERLARQDYGLVPPGQEAYAMLPGAGGVNTVPGMVRPEVPLGVEPKATKPSHSATASTGHLGIFGSMFHRIRSWF